jgi:hypothetical protein
MEYTNDADTFPQDLQEEIEAVDALRENIDEDEINFRQLFNEQLGEAEAWQNTDNKYCKRLYAKLGKIMHCTLCVREIKAENNWSNANAMSTK